MNHDFHRHLDGELPREALSTEDRARAEALESLVQRMRERMPAGAPMGLAHEIMGALPERRPGVRSALGRIVVWLARPRTLSVSPLTGALAAAALAALIVIPWTREAPPAGPTPPAETAGITRIYVEFLLRAPEATSVSVAGNFNDWAPAFLEDLDGDGVWSGRVAVEPGLYEYMFILDGSNWVTDPNAERYVDDGFGNRNAVLTVAAGT